MGDQPDLEARVAGALALEREHGHDAAIAQAGPWWAALAFDLIAAWRARGDALVAKDAALTGIIQSADALLADTGCDTYYLGKKLAAEELRALARLAVSPDAARAVATVPRAALADVLGLAEIGFDATYDEADMAGDQSRRSLEVCLQPFRDAPKGEKGETDGDVG